MSKPLYPLEFFTKMQDPQSEGNFLWQYESALKAHAEAWKTQKRAYAEHWKVQERPLGWRTSTH
jgi:hypothetical protein